VRVAIGHAARNLGDADILAKSTAISESNVEVQAARRRGIPVLSRADLLASITSLRRCAAI
jgi:UDP-N-acetylmuramate--alanine ligase